MKTALSFALIGSAALTAHAGTCQSHAAETPAAMTVANASGSMNIVETAVSAGSFNTLAAALDAAGLVGTLQGDGPFTVFAPTDAAFAKLPEGTLEMLLKPKNRELLTSILTYHVVPGRLDASAVTSRTNAVTVNGQRVDISLESGVSIDSANVVKTDIACSNGVIHVIDTVIMPSTKNIVETAADAGAFGTLLAAAKAAGLVDALTGDGPITVLAPTDQAFAKLPAGTVESLLRPENREKLAEILTFHVIPGRVYSEDALSAQSFKTLQGSRVRFAAAGGELTVNDAQIVMNDLDATNGVIQVIDTVLLPQ